MIISDLNYLEVTSEAVNVVGGTNNKHKNKKYPVIIKDNNVLVAKVTQTSGDIDANIKVIKSHNVDITLNTGNSIDVVQK